MAFSSACFASNVLKHIRNMASTPSTQLGVLSTKSSITLQEFPVPSPGPHEVLIQNFAVASNPKDWKVPQWVDSYSGIEGNDVAGIIVKVGEGVTEYKGGERVAAFTKMRTQDYKACTFGHNLKCPANILLCCSMEHMRSIQ